MPRAEARRATAKDNLRGMLLMLGAALVLSVMHGVIRHVSQQMHPFEVTFFRNLFGLLTVLPLVARNGWPAMRTRQPRLHLLRSAFGICAMLAWFYGLSVVPLAQATALSFTSVIFGSVGAALFLGERMRMRRWSAVAVGFVGALMILRPGWHPVDTGSLVVLFASVCWAAALITVKRLSRNDPVVTIVGWNSVLLTLMSLPVALLEWTTPSAEALAWMLLVGVLATAGHVAMTSAFKLADATAVFPVDFSRLLWASIIGVVAFAEWPDAWTWAGGAIIFASTTYISYREARARG